GGGDVTLAPAEAAATVVLWTCNHCPYALAWHDRIQHVARDYADRDVRFIQINANDADKHPADSFEAMAERVDAGDFASDYVRDAEQTISKQWGARVTPDVFVLDPSGRIVYR
uniref:redoxin family protein n=1 Tax=Klebsiella pneumoniae TaxID=573 RepID=UPI0015E7C440